jgi:PAS domain S-box-containing protein
LPDSGGQYECTVFFSAPAPSGRWLHVTSTLIRDAAGNLTGAVETVEDVTDRKTREFVIQD